MSGSRHTLYLYNTAQRKKTAFVPVNDPVALYCCGPTVYNYAHIGNLRTYIFEDVLKRILELLGYGVRHVVNITDVGHLTSDEDTGEDKMEKGAKREGKSVWDIARHFTDAFMADAAALNIIPADVWPKATDHIEQMIAMVKTLEDKGFTYTTADGVYFDTAKFPAYVTFAGLDPAMLRAGERVDMGDKRSVTDFALWKFSPQSEKRQMEWESPWGKGFPGWHIECSAMSLAYLPQPLDIHCGGSDHVRIHHTNEIAQSEAATGKKFVETWLHGEFLVMDKGKMAKSGGNFVTLSSLKERGVDPLAYRMFCFTGHYRSPLTFSWDGLDAASQSLARMRKSVQVLLAAERGDEVSDDAVQSALGPFYAALCDDMNMPRALAAVWELIRDEAHSAALRTACLRVAETVLGLNVFTAPAAVAAMERVSADGDIITFECDEEPPEVLINGVVDKLTRRKQARAAKEWAVADKIRDLLANAGVVVKDQKDGAVHVLIPVALLQSLEKQKTLIAE